MCSFWLEPGALNVCTLECNLPDNFQSWFSITQLHVWMLMVHLRAEGQGKLYIQELVNRFFEDAEIRIRDHGITQQKVITSYIKDLLAQFHGGVVAYDEGMCKDDPVLAAALWRYRIYIYILLHKCRRFL